MTQQQTVWESLAPRWDTTSGFRERLALLEWMIRQRVRAHEALVMLEHCRYEPSRDRWVGFEFTGQAFRFPIKQEASESLARLESLGVDYLSAATAIGAHP